VAAANPQIKARSVRRRAALIALYLAAFAVCYVLGARGILPYGPLRASTSTPLARIGLALKDPHFHPNADTVAALNADLATVRAGLGSPEREVFDLVAALRGLKYNGDLDVPAATQSCRDLKWARCDQQALEVLRKQARP
jgi:hypothetical protein